MYAALLTSGTFLGVTLLLYLAGRLLIGGNRDKAEAIGSKRPLVLGPFTHAFAYILPVRKKTRDTLTQELLRAGYHHRYALEEYLGMRNAAITCWLIFTAAAMVALAGPGAGYTLQMLALGGVVLVLIFAVPKLVLSSQATERVHKIQYALPDALDMINMMVTAGLPVRRAIYRVMMELKTTHPALACELAIVDHHTGAGSLQQALRQFAKRIDVPDVIALASMVEHADRLGGNIAGAFSDFADSIRRTRRQRADERGNKASVKVLFPIVLFLAPPVYILLLGPAVLELRSFLIRENQPGGALSQSPGSLPRPADPR